MRCSSQSTSDRFGLAKAGQWAGTHPAISQIWRRNWGHVIPFFAFPPEIWKGIYTTNAVESLHMTVRKVIKTRAAFPHEQAVFKLLYLGLQNVAKKWNSVQGWREALNRFQTAVEDCANDGLRGKVYLPLLAITRKAIQSFVSPSPQYVVTRLPHDLKNL
ncbi:MAG TPA: transposase [Bryobacteraceae bacterium]|nr:transposase [Bryobacteraceae bacterium]